MVDWARWRHKYNITVRTRGRHFLLGPGPADCAPTPLSKSNKHGENVLTFWPCCFRLKYTWTENENLWSVGLNKMWQDCLFCKPGSFGNWVWKEQEFQIKNGLMWTFIALLIGNDFTRHKIIVMVLSWLDQRTTAVGIPWTPAGTQMQASCILSFDLDISIRKYMRIVHNYNLRYHIEK